MLYSEQLKLLLGTDYPAMATGMGNDPAIAGYVIRHFRQNNIPVPEPLAALEKKLVAWNLKLLAELKELRRLALEHKLTFIPIKGPLLSLQLYGDLLRHSSDLDVFVGPDVAVWKKVLLGLGYRSSDRYPETFTRPPVTIDLHTSLINTTRVPERGTISRELNTRLTANLTEYDGFTVPTPQFNSWYLPCHNLFHHGFTSLKEHLDFIHLSRQSEKTSPTPLFAAVRQLNRYAIDRWLERVSVPPEPILYQVLYHWFLRQPAEKNRYPLSLFFIPGMVDKLSYLFHILVPPHSFLMQEYGGGGYPRLLFTHWRRSLRR